jgi:hypothetical protein
LISGDPYLDTGEREPEPHAAVTQDVQDALPAEDHLQQHADGGREQDVDGHRDVGGDGADGRDDHVLG